MVCCALLSLLLAVLWWPLRALSRRKKRGPLHWQLTASMPERDVPAPFSMAARRKSFGYALEGLGFVIRNEHNARLHIAAAAMVITIGTILRIDSADWLILIIAIASVWFAETINTAFEYLCDLVTLEKNGTIKRAKDIAAGAVLIAASGAAIVGAIVLFPYVQPVMAEASSYASRH